MGLLSRIANVFRAKRLSRELDDELNFHLTERIEELVASGMSEQQAREEALRRFGNYTGQKERTRDMNIAGGLEAFVADLKQGARQLRLNPGFAAVAILSLALGVGANSSIFQLMNALRLRSLPVQEPTQLAYVDTQDGFVTSGWYSARNRAFTYAQYQEIGRSQQAFDSMLAFANTRFNLSRTGEVRQAEGLFVSANYLDVLGVKPLMGRGYAATDDTPNCGNAGALLNYAFWQRELGGDTSVLNRGIYLNGRTFPVIGITPPEFFGLEPGSRFDVALPLCADTLFSPEGKGRATNKVAWWLSLVGRLKPGWTIERAASHLAHISPRIFRESLPSEYRPDIAKRYLKNKLKATSASSGLSSLRREYENPLWMLLAVTGLVLLIACANLANLLLARASARERELAVRQAIGASRSRVMGQLLTESLLLAGAGAIAGAMVAGLVSRSLVAYLSSPDQRIDMHLGVDWNVFLFTSVLALFTCVLFGLAPAIRATSTPPSSAMHGGRGQTGSVERNGLRRMLVIAQISLSLVLLVGALLFGRSLHNLLTADSGLIADGVLVASIDAHLPQLDPEHRKLVFQEMQERIESQPGVISASTASIVPFSGNGWNGTVFPQSGDSTTGGKESWFTRVGPNYFRTMKTTLLAGREFNRHDDLKAPAVAIVNEEFAKKVFGGANPVGRTFRHQGDSKQPDKLYQIVGQVKNTKYHGLREEFKAIAYFPIDQEKETSEYRTFVVRSHAPLNTTMTNIRQTMTGMQSGLLIEFRILDLQVQRSVLRERLMANLSGGFGLLALMLSTLGLYGVISYMLARRRKELGIRIALGAHTSNVLGLVFNEAARLLVVGLAIGMAISWAVSRYAESLLYGLKANDAMTLALGCALLTITALTAALVPARRATRIDPAVVLRDE
ncbi:MAG TPA: ABC transporter permease [Bryobacteraceae bacterium]|nr:ABC transporter permease [Bryobacteraceae bacterium]